MSWPASEGSFRLEDFAFEFPKDRVADAPAASRDQARLLVLDRGTGAIRHTRFSAIVEYLHPGDCLVVNRSRVIPARLIGRKTTGGRVELLLVRKESDAAWAALSASLRPGMEILLPGGARAFAQRPMGAGEWLLRFEGTDPEALMREHGKAPLPPYILKRRRASGVPGADPDREEDRERYQTVYAREAGSIAAPTAGLHFTDTLLEELRSAGVSVAEIILHVGRGTFQPITAEDVREHRMQTESFQLPEEAAMRIEACRSAGGRIVAVGTTAVRTLETAALRAAPGAPLPRGGDTDLFILPGHRFRMVDALITNFHQPASTPLMLASAFAGRERLLNAYRTAVTERYRLFSYGDSMLIL